MTNNYFKLVKNGSIDLFLDLNSSYTIRAQFQGEQIS